MVIPTTMNTNTLRMILRMLHTRAAMPKLSALLTPQIVINQPVDHIPLCVPQRQVRHDILTTRLNSLGPIADIFVMVSP